MLPWDHMITYSGSPMFGRASSKLKKDDQVQIHSEKSHWWEHIRVGRSCDIAEGEKIEEEKHNQMSVFDFGAINWNSNVRTWMKQSTHRHKQSKGWSMINCQKKKTWIQPLLGFRYVQRLHLLTWRWGHSTTSCSICNVRGRSTYDPR